MIQATIEEMISALKYLSSLDLQEPIVFVNANNNLAVRYRLSNGEYGVWFIEILNSAILHNIE